MDVQNAENCYNRQTKKEEKCLNRHYMKET